MPWKPFCDWWRTFNDFVSTCAVYFRTRHGQNKTHMFDTEGFLPVESLCGVVGSPSWFTIFLIGITVSIWSVIYIDTKCIHSSETRMFTIIECEIVHNVCHVTSTCSFISWWYGAANDITTLRTERSSWNSLELNCVPALVWIIYISQQSNPPTFPNLAWNIYSLYMTSSVVIFSIP